MKRKIPLALFGLFAAGTAAYSQGLYYIGSESDEPLPLKWVVGASLIYDDNVTAGYSGAGIDEEDSLALNPYVGLSFVSITPQSTWDVYARLGTIYYFDAPQGAEDFNSQSRAGVNFTHRFSERLRFSSQNFISYEMEPDYSYGYASTRTNGEYFFWQSDNSVGFRWTERLATYTGLRLSGTDYGSEVENNDRLTWELYNQFRYQFSPQTVLTMDYRYGQTSGNGVSSDSTNQYLLFGAEHRFSPNTIGIVRAGAQFRDVDNGSSETSPYLEAAFNWQATEALRLRSYARYGIEDYDTVQSFPTGAVEYSDRRTLRFGVSGEYVFNPLVSMFGGVDYIPTRYQEGRVVSGNPATPTSDADEDIINAYIGVSYRFSDFLTANASYNFTDSSSDFDNRDYDRNRISIGVSAEF
jgi:Putative beta-barrel porin 2